MVAESDANSGAGIEIRVAGTEVRAAGIEV